MKTILITTLLAFAFISTTSAQEKINWLTLDEAVKLNESSPKKIFIDFYTDWCGWCKKMEASTFSDPKIVEYINKHYYAVKFNGESKEAINFAGRTYEFSTVGSRGANQFAVEFATNNGRLGYPTSVVLSEDLDKLGVYPGFKNTNAMNTIITYYGSDAYETQNWQQFNQGNN